LLNDLRDDIVAATAAGGCTAMVTNLRDVARASGSYGTADISISEGVAMTHEHRLLET
jgi:predicted ThiF/HesA family dinucleotide-utilizing enzyme